MQVFFNGLISGLITSILAVGFSIVFIPTRVFHVALGGIYAVAPFITWSVVQAELGWIVAIFIALMTSVTLSIGLEIFNHNPLERRGASEGAHLISSLGIYIVLVQATVLIWGNETRTFGVEMGQSFTLGSVSLTKAQLIGGCVSVVVLAIFSAGLIYTKLGLQLRALADNPKETALQGYNVRRLRLWAFGISGLFGAISALLIAYDVGFDPHGGLHALLLAVVAAIIGGYQSFMGPILGGILLGVVRSESAWLLSAKWQDAVTFFLFALFLFARPYGLIGSRTNLKEEV